jgi:hypothetical protein
MVATETENRGMQPSPSRPRKELLDLILVTASLPGTLGAISQAIRKDLEFSWKEFTEAVDYLVSKGELQVRGNGFDVIYSVTELVERPKDRNRATAF